jgi:hypothetical protein
MVFLEVTKSFTFLHSYVVYQNIAYGDIRQVFGVEKIKEEKKNCRLL